MREMLVMKKEVEIQEDDFVGSCHVKPGDQVQIVVNGKEANRFLVLRDKIVGTLAEGCDFHRKLKEVNEASLNRE